MLPSDTSSTVHIIDCPFLRVTGKVNGKPSVKNVVYWDRERERAKAEGEVSSGSSDEDGDGADSDAESEL